LLSFSFLFALHTSLSVNCVQSLTLVFIVGDLNLDFPYPSKLFDSLSSIHLFAFAMIFFALKEIHSALLAAVAYLTFLEFTIHFVMVIFTFDLLDHFLCFKLIFPIPCISF